MGRKKARYCTRRFAGDAAPVGGASSTPPRTLGWGGKKQARLGRFLARLVHWKKVAEALFSDSGFVAAGKRRDFCRLRRAIDETIL
jgi:hypothetical protein